MSRLFIPSKTSIGDLLNRHAVSVEAAGQQRWQFHLSLRPEAGLDAMLRVERGWLRIAAPLDGDASPEAADSCRLSDDRLQAMLAANARLPGGVKFVLADDPPRAMLAAEIPFLADQDEDEDLELDDRIGRLCRGLRRGALGWRYRIAEPDEFLGAVHRPAPAARAERRFEEICRELGWTVSRRGNGRLAVRLDLREAFYQAQVEATDEGLRLCVALEQSVADVDVCRRAADVLLLSACGAVRMAAATVVEGEASRQYRWEAAFAAAAQPTEWGHALSALTIACQATAAELGALEDPVLAETYLQLRGMGRTSL
jgi:hypothetical protein